MILIFLGSWRSTVDHRDLDPALDPRRRSPSCWALGETLNIMTLGGLALAVGILVDDATVTIENINWHLEQGKEVETAIIDGAAQIVTPAFVSLLCICIVFVPMFFLHRRRALPVRADGRSRDVRDGVLVHPVAHAGADDGELSAAQARARVARGKPPTRNPLVAIPARLRAALRALPRIGYRELLMLALAHRAVFVIGFLAFVAASFALTPFLGRDFFPSVDAGQILMHARTRVGTRVEESANQFAEITKAIRQIIPPNEIATIVDNIGMPVSGINMTYNNTGTIGTADGDIQIKLREGHRPTADYVQLLREELPARFPGVTFSFLPADIVSQILNFGAPAPIDLQIRGPNLRRTSPTRSELLRKLRRVPGPRRRAHPAVAQRPGLQRRCRPHARAVCRRHGARRDQQHGGEPRGHRARSRRPTGSIPRTACPTRS